VKRPRKFRHVVRENGLLRILRGQYSELPVRAVVAGLVMAAVAAFGLALWVEVGFGSGLRYHAHRGAFATGAMVGVAVGTAIRVLGGSGRRAGACAIGIGVLSAAAGMLLGSAWRKPDEPLLATLFEGMPSRPVLLLLGSALGALILIPDIARNDPPREDQG